MRTKDGKVSAHYEHNVCIKKGQADVLSSFEEVEAAEKNNEYLNSSYYWKNDEFEVKTTPHPRGSSCTFTS